MFLLALYNYYIARIKTFVEVKICKINQKYYIQYIRELTSCIIIS